MKLSLALIVCLLAGCTHHVRQPAAPSIRVGDTMAVAQDRLAGAGATDIRGKVGLMRGGGGAVTRWLLAVSFRMR